MTSVFNHILDYSYRYNYVHRYFLKGNTDLLDEKKKAISEYFLSDECVKDLKCLRNGELFFHPPTLKMVPKNNGKYRKTFCYNDKDSAILSFIVRSLFNIYDSVFSDNLYSSRKKLYRIDIFDNILQTTSQAKLYSCKLDVSSYDASIDGELLRNMIREYIDDKEMAEFLCRVTECRQYTNSGKIYEDEQAVRTGNPLAPFFENLYLTDYDKEIASYCSAYFRFCDDILFFGTKEQIDNCIIYTKDVFQKKNLHINESKFVVLSPSEPVEFLGMKINDDIDIGEQLINDMKHSLIKKTRSILSLKNKLGLSDTLAMNLMWKYEQTCYPLFQFRIFSLITKTDGLRKIDRIMQNALRTVGSGKLLNGKYRIQYDKLREIGYKPLVSIYYKWQWSKKYRTKYTNNRINGCEFK